MLGLIKIISDMDVYYLFVVQNKEVIEKREKMTALGSFEISSQRFVVKMWSQFFATNPVKFREQYSGATKLNLWRACYENIGLGLLGMMEGLCVPLIRFCQKSTVVVTDRYWHNSFLVAF